MDRITALAEGLPWRAQCGVIKVCVHTQKLVVVYCRSRRRIKHIHGEWSEEGEIFDVAAPAAVHPI